MRALLLVDIQRDFLPGGALAAEEGNKILPVVKELINKDFDLIVASKDWHPLKHGSFASTQGKKVGEVIELEGLSQHLWPDHCVQGTEGAEFPDAIDPSSIDHIVLKGTELNVDSYSAFFDNGKRRSTGLDRYLKDKGIQQLYIVGLVTDYCVKFTALDAAALGFTTYVITDGCVALDIPEGEEERAIAQMRQAGVQLITSEDL